MPNSASREVKVRSTGGARIVVCPLSGKVHDRPVLADNRVDEAQCTGNAAKLVEYPTGHKQDLDATSASRSNGIDDGWIHPVVARDRAVVVECQNAEFHRAERGSCNPKAGDRRRSHGEQTTLRPLPA